MITRDAFSVRSLVVVAFAVCGLAAMPVVAQEEPFCPWEGAGHCGWQPRSWVVDIELQASPPCSTRVELFGLQCGERVEIRDVHFSMDTANMTPTNCISQDAIIALGWANLWYLAYVEVMKDVFVSDGVGTVCPLTYIYNVKIPSPCRQPYVEWTVGSTTTSVAWSTNTPWSTYNNLMLLQGGSDPVITLKHCGQGCCEASFEICLQNGVPVVVSSGFSPVEYACPSNPNHATCKMFLCSP
ncbi:MAG TPA: hypothetical protein DIS79_11040 [Bacteroidetes bacterium]|nr:hypothetical protein [Bacteroidota bacterium]HRK04793.1 hypothetical protein [Chlorobiota bacterium]